MKGRKIGTRIRKEEKKLILFAKECTDKILELVGVLAELLNTKSIYKKQLQDMAVSYRVKHILNMQHCNSISRHILKRNKTICTYKDLGLIAKKCQQFKCL